MPKKTFKYREKDSLIFGRVKRPLIEIEVYSQAKKRWLVLSEVLADTGADVSLLPRYIGRTLVNDITKGKYIEIRGIVPYSKLVAFIHNLKFRINGKDFTAPVAIADSDDTPPILGRINGLDLFKALFLKGKEVDFQWEGRKG